MITTSTPKNAKEYYIMSEGIFGFSVCQTPMFFMQYLVAYMSGKMNMYDFLLYDVASQYEKR